jgi:tetratricopeptide (TPR) repeat protein
MARYLERQTTAQVAGFGFADATGDVVPHEAVPTQPVDPRVAWNDAVAVFSFFPAVPPTRSLAAPPDWPAVVASREPAAALAFCAGNFPQLVRNLQPLLHSPDLTTLRSPGGRALPAADLSEWAAQTTGKGQYPQTLLAVGALRLAGHHERAAELMQTRGKGVPAEWQAAWANEEAALAWHRGRTDEAVALWQKQAECVPVLFNRGMAALFTGRPAEARLSLNRAVEQIPEASAWHHLGRLYLALAEMRG